MRGHIAKKGERYYAVIYEGVDPGTGKPRHRWHAAGPTRREAERLLADLVVRPPADVRRHGRRRPDGEPVDVLDGPDHVIDGAVEVERRHDARIEPVDHGAAVPEVQRAAAADAP